MATIAVVVSTYGDWDKWSKIAETALESAEAQSRPADYITHSHDHDNLAVARNSGAGSHGCEWQIFLDADDILGVDYLAEMEAAIDGPGIYRPSTLGIYPDGTRDDEAWMIPETTMMDRNCVVIGAMHRYEDFSAIGGFEDYTSLEDWDLFTRLIFERNCEMIEVPGAIYGVGLNEDGGSDGRNSEHGSHGEIYRKLYSRNQSLYKAVQRQRQAEKEQRQRQAKQFRNHGVTPVTPQ